MSEVEFTVPPPTDTFQWSTRVGAFGETHYVPHDAPRWCHHLVVTIDQECDWRVCLLCGRAYDRGEVLIALRRAIRDRYRLPQSPWTAAERSVDLD